MLEIVAIDHEHQQSHLKNLKKSIASRCKSCNQNKTCEEIKKLILRETLCKDGQDRRSHSDGSKSL